MFIKKLCTGALFSAFAFAGYGQSTTVNFSAAPGQKDVYFNGLPVANGNYVQVGYFTPGFDVLGNALNLPTLAAAWHNLGSANISTLFGEPGRFAGNLTTSDPAFSNQKICLWIFKTSNNGDPVAASYANVQGYGLFSGSTANWLFPASGAVPPGNMTSVTSSDVNQSYFGAYDTSHLLLNPVPEPSTIALFAIVGGGVFWRVRRSTRV